MAAWDPPGGMDEMRLNWSPFAEQELPTWDRVIVEPQHDVVDWVPPEDSLLQVSGSVLGLRFSIRR